jgi:hypothetical protein
MAARTPTILASAVLMLILSACSPADRPPANPAPSPAPSPSAGQPVAPQPTSEPSPAVQLPEIDATPYAGPAVSLDVLQRESFPPQCVASIEITTPTGGWTLALDQATVVGDTAKVFVTLERPGEGEMVTQALVTHRQQFVSANPCFKRAEVYVHLAQRGVSTLTTNYRLAAHH